MKRTLNEVRDELRAMRELNDARRAGGNVTAEHEPRTPDQILNDFDDGCRGVSDIDMRSVMWEIIEDVRSSYRLAMENLNPPLDPERVDEVQDTVTDYLVNHYGDD